MANTAKRNCYTKIDITTQYMYVRVGGRCMQCEGCCSVYCGVCSYCKEKEIWWNWKKEESVHKENMCCSKGISCCLMNPFHCFNCKYSQHQSSLERILALMYQILILTHHHHHLLTLPTFINPVRNLQVLHHQLSQLLIIVLMARLNHHQLK